MLKNTSKTRNVLRGFTLVEFILVIAAIAVLLVILLEVLRPAERLAAARNTERRAETTTILNAVYQYALDNNGALPASITTTQTEICKTGGDCTGLVDLSVLTAGGKYLVSIPTDPTGESANGAGYEILRTPGGRVKVAAPHAELGVSIDGSK